MSWNIERFTAWSDLAETVPEWEQLAGRMRPWTPFTSPTWNQLWWKHCRKDTIAASDELYVHTVRSRSDRRLVAVAPLLRRRFPGVGPAAFRVIDFFGSDPSLTEIRGLVCEQSQQAAVFSALREHFRAHDDEWDIINWHGLTTDTAGLDTQTGRHLRVKAEAPDYFMPLAGQWENVLASVSSNMRKSVRKSYEFLASDGYQFCFKVIDQSIDVRKPLNTFYRLHAARGSVTDMKVKHPDRFSPPEYRGFLDELAFEMWQQDRFRIFEIEVDGETIGSRLAFIFDGTLYLYYSGFDPEWKKYAVMTLLMAEIMKWAIDQKIKIVNLSTGSDASKLRWKPSNIDYFGATEERSARGQTLSMGYDFVARTRKALAQARGFRSGEIAKRE
jgi:CelD/BcsL family acetyltransferase involved in cellulose biosynthesis